MISLPQDEPLLTTPSQARQRSTVPPKKVPPGPCGPGGNYTFALLKFLD